MKVVIIGGVVAGMSTATKLKRNLRDAVDIVVYEKGGAVSYGACGIPFYVSDKIQDPDELIAKRPEQFAQSGIDVRVFHEVQSVNPAEKTVTVWDSKANTTFTRSYDKLAIGSGAGVKRFPPFTAEAANLFVVRDVADGTAIKTALGSADCNRVVIVGAGFIGLEMAEACRKHGKQVTVIELAERVLTPMDPEFSAMMQEELERNEVAVHTSCSVTELVLDGGRITGVLAEGTAGSQTIPADMVINCAGIAPATAFIDGVEKAANGAIVVDEQMRTSLPDIYAAGDCSIMRSAVTGQLSYAPLGTNANKQGRIIADVLGGNPPKPFGLIGSTAIKLFELDGAKVGLSEQDAKALGLQVKVNTITGNSYASYYGKEKLTIKVVYDSDTRRLLGAQGVGAGIVVPRINYYAIAIYAGLTVDQFGFLDLCYSPPFSGVWDAALIASNTAK